MVQERGFVGAFERVATFEIRGETLELRDAAGDLLASLTAARELPLVGTTWQLVRYDAGGGVVAEAIAGTTVTAVFDDTGTVGGQSGCNQYSAPYKADESTLTIEQAVATLMACTEPAGVMEQEAAFLTALENVASYRLQDYGLELLDAGGTLLAEFKPQLTR
jgi:heat shock protein HslJ